jgi:tripartite-type tricarboxylate transporter receptor subunit TctC
VPQWITGKKIRVIAQYGLTRHPSLGDVPSVLELTKSDADRRAMTVMFARTEYGRPYFLPPEVPAARVTALRRAFDETMRDPAFVADAAKLQLDVDPMSGEQVQALVGDLARTPADVVARVRGILAGAER